MQTKNLALVRTDCCSKFTLIIVLPFSIAENAHILSPTRVPDNNDYYTL